MTYNLELIDVAEEELWETVDWYDAQKDRLGKEFAKELQNIIGQLKENPFQFPEVIKNKRKAILKRFPYQVIYEIHDDTIYVIAIFHTSRNPKRWQKR